MNVKKQFIPIVIILCISSNAYSEDLELLGLSYSYTSKEIDTTKKSNNATTNEKMHNFEIAFPLYVHKKKFYLINFTELQFYDFHINNLKSNMNSHSYSLYSLDESIQLYYKFSNHWSLLSLANIRLAAKDGMMNIKEVTTYSCAISMPYHFNNNAVIGPGMYHSYYFGKHTTFPLIYFHYDNKNLIYTEGILPLQFDFMLRIFDSFNCGIYYHFQDESYKINYSQNKTLTINSLQSGIKLKILPYEYINISMKLGYTFWQEVYFNENNKDEIKEKIKPGFIYNFSATIGY